MKKLFKIFLLSIIFTLSTAKVSAAAFSVSSSASTVSPGGTFNVNISFPGEGKFSVAVSNGTITSSSSFWYPDTKQVTVKAGNSGTVKVTVTAVDITNSNTLEQIENQSVSVSVNIKQSTNSGGNTGGSDNTGGGNTGTYNPEMPKGETEAEKKARELAERQKKPLIENISIISESTRLKGETLLEDNPSESKFDYAFELPRGVDAFKLDLVPIADDVVLEYTQMYKLDAGHDKVEIVVRASQDEVEQEFKITVKKAPESKAVYTVGQGSYRFLNDELLDKVISKYGFEVVYFDEDVDKTDYYYRYGESKLVLVYGDNGEGKWLLIDGNRNVLNEVLIVVDGEDKVTLLVDKVLEEDDKRTYGGRRYGPIVVPVDNDFYNLDYGLNFATDIKGWEHDLDSYFTHAIDLNGDEKLVYLDKQGHTEVAYVAFDNQGVSLDGMVMPVIAGVSGISSIGLLIYSRKQSRKISKLLRRRSQD